MNSQTLWTCSIAQEIYPDTIESTSVGIFLTKILAYWFLLETLVKKGLVVFDNEDEDFEKQIESIQISNDENEVEKSFELIINMCGRSYNTSNHYDGWNYSLTSFTV